MTQKITPELIQGVATYCGLSGSDSPPNANPAWTDFREIYRSIVGANGEKFAGLNDVAALMLLSYLAPRRDRGAAPRHVLLEGAAGTAKTELTKAVAGSLECFGEGTPVPSRKKYARVQGSPDLLPSAFVGYEARNTKGLFRFNKGDLLKETAVYHVDEINRIPSRTLSVLLEAMAEGQVTLSSLVVKAGLRQPKLPWLFVVGTQNPGSFVGTNPLPEPLLDRFMIRVIMPFPDRGGLVDVIHALDSTATGQQNPNLTKLNFDAMRGAIARIVGKDASGTSFNHELAEDIMAVVLGSWPLEASGLIPNLQGQVPHHRQLRTLVDNHLEYGLGVRAGQALRDLASAVAWSRTGGQIPTTVTRVDLEKIAPYVLSHRLRFKPGQCVRPSDQMDFVGQLLHKVWQWRDYA